jgi:hypothetical protein
MEGWPRLMVQILSDRQGRSTLEGYGYTHLPTNPGSTHELEIMCWKPKLYLEREDGRTFSGKDATLSFGRGCHIYKSLGEQITVEDSVIREG